MSTLKILNELAATNSTLEKEAILRREVDNELLKRVFHAAYNPMVTFGIKQIPEFTPREESQTLDYTIEFFLPLLASRSLTGNRASDELARTLSALSPDNAVVLSRIIDRDLRCGCSDTLASRVWPGFVPSFDVMLCDKDMKKIKYPAYAQPKMDGARVHMYFDGKKAAAFSRAGKEFHLHGVFDEAAAKFMKPGETFDGELLVVIDGKVAERTVGNGILNKANKGTITKEDAERIIMVVWDIVDFSSTIPYKERLEELDRRKCEGKFEQIQTKLVTNEEEAMDFYAEMRKRGEEGAIIKNLMSLWVPKRSKDLCKLKAIETADLRVIGVQEGTGKYVGKLGALICETADGKIQVSVGSGFTDAERSLDLNRWEGKIVEVLYNEKIKSKGSDTMSLFLPRFSCERFDKDVANTAEELK